jgi:hypothetical protein
MSIKGVWQRPVNREIFEREYERIFNRAASVMGEEGVKTQPLTAESEHEQPISPLVVTSN